MIDVGYLLAGLVIGGISILIKIYVDFIKFQKWLDQQQEATPYQLEKPVKVSRHQAEVFNRSMRRIRKELKK